MRDVEIEIEGICPILFNRFTEEAQKQLDTGARAKKKNKQQRIDDAVFSCYFDKKGYIGVPAINIKKCWLEGCGMASMKVGRRSAVPFLRATTFLHTDFVLFHPKRKEPEGIHQVTGRIPPRTGARVVLRRPYVDTGWILRFKAMLSDDRITTEMAKVALVEAGLLAGMCDHRPEYGRFKVNKFDEVK